MIADGEDILASDIIGLVTTTTAAGTTLSVTTVAGERLIVWAKGDIDGVTSTNHTVELKYDGATKDTIVVENGGDGFNPRLAFSLMYTEVPGAATHNITLTTSAGSISHPVIIAMKISTG